MEDYRTPGQLIEDLLAKRAWTQRVLAAILGVNATTVNKVILGHRPVDAEMALALETVFGAEGSADRFLQLQREYDLQRARLETRPDPALKRRAEVFGEFPVGEMIRRGWIRADNVRDFARIEEELARFFGARTTAEIPLPAHASKKTNVSDDVTPKQLAWLYRVRQLARAAHPSQAYSQKAVTEAIRLLEPLRISEEAVRGVPKILGNAGIRFVIVEALPGAKIDGVAFWLDSSSPVIGLSLRYNRLDNFWFCLRHELEHVRLLHGREDAILMVDAALEGARAGTGPDIPEQERVANKAAAEFCVPQGMLNKFIASKAPLFTQRDIAAFATLLKVHPSLVAGQIQYRTDRYDLHKQHHVEIRPFIVPTAMVDGWGDIPPI